jgi:carbon monoxide dehydrogenase subunit G
MNMNMTGTQRIAAPVARVWEALNDPATLRASIPGCQSLDKEAADRFTATVEVKVGPIGARFKGAVSLTELDPPNGYTLILQGNGGITGSVKGSAKVRLHEESGNTRITYQVDAEVAGRMAQLGGPIIDATAKQLAGKFFARFGEIVGGARQPTDTAHVKPPVTPIDKVGVTAPGSIPMAWILATVVAALAGFLIGRSAGGAASDWAGVAIGLLLIVVAGAAFEYGRRAAAPVITLDSALLRRLLESAKE